MQIVKSDDQYAELIYIKNYIPDPLNDDTSISDVTVKGLPVVFDENGNANVTVTATQNDTDAAKMEIGTVAPGAETYVTISGVDGEWTEDAYGNTDPFSDAGERTITIEVTAEDDTKATYTIHVTVNAAVEPVVITDNMGENATAEITVSGNTITVSDNEAWTVADLKEVLVFDGIVEGSVQYMTRNTSTDRLTPVDDTANLYTDNVILVVTRAEDGATVQYNIVKTSGN